MNNIIAIYHNITHPNCKSFGVTGCPGRGGEVNDQNGVSPSRGREIFHGQIKIPCSTKWVFGFENVFSFFFSELLRNYRNLPVFTEAFLKETKS